MKGYHRDIIIINQYSLTDSLSLKQTLAHARTTMSGIKRTIIDLTYDSSSDEEAQYEILRPNPQRRRLMSPTPPTNSPSELEDDDMEMEEVVVEGHQTPVYSPVPYNGEISPAYIPTSPVQPRRMVVSIEDEVDWINRRWNNREEQEQALRNAETPILHNTRSIFDQDNDADTDVEY